VSPSKRKLWQRLRRAYKSFVDGMEDMDLPDGEIQKHVDMVRPWLKPIEDQLQPIEEAFHPRNREHREHDRASVFTFTKRDASQEGSEPKE
jgi:hypothetical protein